MSVLAASDFSAFFEGIHGQPPFPWQVRLAEIVIATGRWPSLLDLPTGAGKTAAIDVAVFHLACAANQGEKRRAPLRILFVIDRRIVVDAAFERARKIAEALRRPMNKIVGAARERLTMLSGNPDHPLDVVRLRGGAPQERDWARSPAQPLVAVSTVDQVGSRLLFRGYGVSPKMWPVHAGLVGSDVLWLLDEVHLSKPLEDTLGAIADGHKETGNGVLAQLPRLAPFAVVKLSATPGAEKPADWFPGKDFDIRKRAPKTFLDRLDARKRASLVEVDDVPKALAAHALHFAGLAEPAEYTAVKKGRKGKRGSDVPALPPARRVAVVVNRVDVARKVFEAITQKAGQKIQTLLLTGRIRPLDRERVLEKLKALLAGRDRPDPDKPMVLVATQTIEAGADFDVDALVTEIASLDSLRQRFGRVDRLGTRRNSFAAIICPTGRPPKDTAGEDNPWMPITRIYGQSAYATKVWLEKLGAEIDFGIEEFEKNLATLGKEDLESMLAHRARAPVMLPPYIDLWTTTSPAPAATPDPSLFLHGPGTAADVQIVWRADIDPKDEASANTSLELCPPSALEALSVPVWAVRRWLREEKAEAPIADVPEKAPDGERGASTRSAPVLRRSGETWRSVSGDAVEAGDMIVVPTHYGGCDAWGWEPRSKAEVTDLGVEAHYRQRLKGALRITLDTLTNALGERGTGNPRVSREIWDRIARFISEMGDDIDAEAVRAVLAGEGNLPETWRSVLTAMEHRRPAVEFYEEENHARGFVLFAQKRLGAGVLDSEETWDGADATTDREDSSAIGTEVLLVDHLRDVERWARHFARCAGLNEQLVELVGLAARLHDLGKADPRFQADLAGSSALALRDADFAALLIAEGELLAKSARTESGKTGQRLLAVPKGFRHEALSVPLAERHPEVMALAAEERDLVLWLIGTHHGFGRPFFPPCLDSAPQTQAKVEIDGKLLATEAREAPLRLDQGWFERAGRVNRRFGPWEVARLEAIVRLADHVASAEEQEKPNRQARGAAVAGVAS